MNFIRVLLICVFLFANISFAQKILTLKDAISIALNKSFGIKSAEFSLESSQKMLESIKLGLRTSVNMEFDLPRYARTLSSEFNPQTGTEQFFEVGYTTFESRLYFTQPIIYTNGTFSLVGSLWKRDQFSAQSTIPPDYYSNLSLHLSQPLFTFNSQKTNLQRAEINLQKSERNYTDAEKGVIYNVTANFYQLYQAKKQVEIAEEKVKQTQESYNTALNKFKAGLIAQVEALQLEVDLASSKNDLLNAQRNYTDAKNNFKLLIGIDLDENIDVSAKLEYKPLDVDLQTAIKYALANRTDLMNDKSDIDLKSLSVEEVDSKGNISALLTANYGINKNDNKFVDIFHAFAEDRSLTLTLKVPIIDWGQNNKQVESAEADLKLAKLSYNYQEEEIKNEITAIVNKIKSAKARVEVLSKSVELAQKSYNISLSRFESGTITSFDLSQMQLRLTDAKINSLSALIDYELAVADLSRKTLHDYEKN